MNALFAWLLLSPAHLAAAQEPDHAIHEELRAMMRDIQAAINGGDPAAMLPHLTEDIAATSITQEVISNKAEVTAYFQEWFGQDKYMKTMHMELEADALTELSADRSWGLVRGKGIEHYVANNGDQFDFVTRWTAVVVRADDGRWRLKAIHFGTNHLDNPVLTKVAGTLVRNGVIGAGLALVVGAGLGFVLGARWGRRAATRPAR